MAPLNKVRRIYYGWVLVGLAALVMSLAIVPFFYGQTAWFVALEHRFGWSRFQLSAALSLTRIEGSIMGPVGGFLIDKLGSRIMVFIGMIIMGLGFIAFSFISELWHFYGAFILMSVGAGMGTWLAMMTTVNSWFVRRRSTAMSMVVVGSQLGVVALIPVLTWAIGGVDAEDPDNFVANYGWETTSRWIGILIVALAFPISRLVRNRPEEYGLRPDGAKAAPLPAASPVGGTPQPADDDDQEFTWQQAIRTKNFWIISVGHASTSIVIVTIMVHLGPMLTDMGFSSQWVASLVSIHVLVGIGALLLGGWIGDRVPIRWAIFGFSIFQSFAVIIVLFTANNTPISILFAVFMGIGMGRGGMTTAIRGVYFGRKSFASITGWSMLPMNVLMFFMPPFAGKMFDETGSYAVPFVTIAAISFVGAALFLLLGDPKPRSASPRPAGQASQPQQESSR